MIYNLIFQAAIELKAGACRELGIRIGDRVLRDSELIDGTDSNFMDEKDDDDS